MSLPYIAQYYNVPARLGGRVEYTGNAVPQYGTITGSEGALLLVRLDGEFISRHYHPTWELTYK